MVLAPNTPPCHDYYLCQIIFKYHNARGSYEPDTILVHTNKHTHKNKWSGKTLYTLPPFHGDGIKNKIYYDNNNNNCQKTMERALWELAFKIGNLV